MSAKLQPAGSPTRGPLRSPGGRPIVAIVGRPNVGKSTFFNRLVGNRRAIESDVPGTTRDRIYADAEWCGKEFTLIDTAGLFDNVSSKDMAKLTKVSIEIAIEEADIIIFLVDVTEITSIDLGIAKLLRKSGKKIFLLANKADNQSREIATQEIFRLGFGQANFASSISGRGVADFLDKLTADFSNERLTNEKVGTIDVALIGRPNVGKSTLLNAIAGTSVAIVSETPGTTRDTTDATVNFGGEKIKFLDTAGIRRRGKVEIGIEKFSVIRTMKALETSAVTVILVDAEEGITNQDSHIAGYAKDLGKSIIIAVNKFDLWDGSDKNVPTTDGVGIPTEAPRRSLRNVEKIKEKMSLALGKLQKDLAFIPFVPVIFISAKTGQNQKILLKKIIEVYRQRFIQIGTDELKEIIAEAAERNQQLPKILDFYQEKTNPVVFKLVCRNKTALHFSHLRYLENSIRDQYPFTGTPLFIDIIEKKN